MQSTVHTEFRDVKETCARLQQHIAMEVKRRAEGDKGLQQLVEARAKEITEEVNRKVQDRLLQLHRTVDVLTKRVEKLSNELALEREKNVRLTQELKFQSTQGISDVRHALEQERSQRLEKEALLGKKLTEDAFRIQERQDVERHAREAMVAALREELQKVATTRAKHDERLLLQLHEDVASLRAAVKGEQGERERGEEHLAATMNEVVKQVHEGLQALAGA